MQCTAVHALFKLNPIQPLLARRPETRFVRRGAFEKCPESGPLIRKVRPASSGAPVVVVLLACRRAAVTPWRTRYLQ
eukprot:scaffold168_cov410-Prasinococcus_capsulatus_cf.AAC.8